MGGGFPDEELDLQDRTDRTRRKQHINGDQEMNNAQYEAILKGGEQVTSVLQEMITLVSFHLLLLAHQSILFFPKINN